MFCRYAFYTLSVAIFALQFAVAKGIPQGFRIHTDLPVINKDKEILLDVFFSTDSAFTGTLQVQFFKYQNGNDSIIVLSKKNLRVNFKKGVNKTKIDFSKEDSNTTCAPKFYEILKRTENVPPGSYKVFLTVIDSGKFFYSVYIHDIDSELSPTSPVRGDINKSLSPKSKSFLGLRLKKAVDHAKSTSAGTAMQHARGKVDAAARKRGLTTEHYEKNNKSYVDLFYQDWFAGRYEVKNNESLSKQVDKQTDKVQAPSFNTVNTTTLDQPSLFSQYKTVNTDKKKQDEIRGEISLNTNLNSGQEQYSGVDNNYYELRGRVEMPIANIPVEMEGYYTSQDNNREIKSSYFRAHYDVDKMKEAVKESTTSYNNKFAETKNKGTGMTSIYQSSISNLEGQKAKLEGELASELAKPNMTDPKIEKQTVDVLKKEAKDTTGIKKAAVSTADSMKAGSSTDDSLKKDNSQNDTSAAAKAKEKEARLKAQEQEKKQRIAEKRKKIEELERKINKYKILLAQYENTNHFDSSVAYNKTKDFDNQSDNTYKQLAKRSASILPDGQAKSFLAGVTTMDAGMFAKEQSKYTMSGQMMKGIDFGYDLGICETGVTVGKTQYIGSDGSLDKYTCYSGRVMFKPLKRQKVGLVYYGYTPDHKMVTSDAFFNNANISAPSFFQPTSIFSLAYSGAVSKFVTLTSEAATSVQQSTHLNDPAYSLGDKMAYHFSADGKIPNTTISLQAAYDKTGIGFVNNTLPVLLTGTQQYKVSGKSDFFRSYFTLGLEFDQLIQNNSAIKGTSTKWGFDAKTNLKRYPNVQFSYKPFTTFRSYTDTLNIPQRPLIGSVWIGKATYQVRMHQRSLHFSLIYNKNNTTMDTTKYGSSLAQLSCSYSDKMMTNTLNVGQMQLSGTSSAVPQTTPNNTSFFSHSTNYNLNKKITLTGGQDFGIAAFGLCRYSVNGGLTYRPAKTPVTLRTNLRYNTYKLNEIDNWHKIYGGNIEVTYRFKSKIKNTY